jgi:hypothetical protein
LAAACRKVSRRATVAWRKRILTRNIRIQESRVSSKDFKVNGMRKGPECKNGIRRRDVKKLPHLKKERTTNSIKGWGTGQWSYLGKGGTLRINLYEISEGRSRNKSSELLVGYEE